MKFNLTSLDDGTANITVFADGDIFTANQDHPNWTAIKEGVLAGDENVSDLFDTGQAIVKRFENISESGRVTVSNGRIFFDGVEVDNALTDQIVRFLDEGVDDWKPLVRFYEKLETNPTQHSREQLYRWLATHNFSITESGDIVGYKSVNRNAKGDLVSVHAGPAVVNGEAVNGNVPNNVGSVITLSRAEVDHNPNSACSTGLHVGNWGYVGNFSGNVKLVVLVNPRDVVSVPTDAADAKMRTCRYEVVGIVTEPYTDAVVALKSAEDVLPVEFRDDEDDDYYDPYAGSYGASYYSFP